MDLLWRLSQGNWDPFSFWAMQTCSKPGRGLICRPQVFPPNKLTWEIWIYRLQFDDVLSNFSVRVQKPSPKNKQRKKRNCFHTLYSRICFINLYSLYCIYYAVPLLFFTLKIVDRWTEKQNNKIIEKSSPSRLVLCTA